MPYDTQSAGRQESHAARGSAAHAIQSNPFMQFTDQAQFRKLVDGAQTKAGPARSVSPLTIAGRLQHMKHLADPNYIADDESEIDDPSNA